MPKKTVRFNPKGIEKLPDNKPVVYKIQTDAGKTNYVGVAQRGRVQDRLREHLPDINIVPESPGLKAIAHGFALAHGDNDHEKVRLETPMYDALYIWCQQQVKQNR